MLYIINLFFLKGGGGYAMYSSFFSSISTSQGQTLAKESTIYSVQLGLG